jgi:lipopolysaccharide/colanic/teichoic acid biosynthesis glycosyltransferase
MNVRAVVAGETASPVPGRRRNPFMRRRFQFAGALFVSAVIPYLFRSLTIPGAEVDPPVANALFANLFAVTLAMWVRLSIATYPGIRSSYYIIPLAAAAHATVIVLLLMARLPYDRLALLAGVLLHILWNYAIYFLVERRLRPRIAIVPFGDAEKLNAIEQVDWTRVTAPRLEGLTCDSLVADFSADMPDEWEGFLADAALAGRVVYQHKQLSESLTGRVELTHLSENNFGSLVPMRGWFHLKGIADFIVAVALLPLALPVMALAAIAIRLEDRGPILFRQARIGHAARRITVYKFRTMRPVQMENELHAAMTSKGDDRITRVGNLLRRYRIDELPQIFNILKFQMSWIGPRPEAEVLSVWYTRELPFYRYRHVVKPGISGWAQVNQGHVAEVEQVHRKLQYDFYYIKYFSPWLDLLILFRTIKTMLSGFGAK